MTTVLVVVLLLQMIAVIFAVMGGCLWVFHMIALWRGRRLGSVTMHGTIVYFVVLVLSIVAILQLPPVRKLMAATGPAHSTQLLLVFGSIDGLLILAAAATASILLLTVRPPRRFAGRRRTRIPYGPLAALVWILCLAAPVALLVTGVDWWTALRIFGVSVGLAGYLGVRAKRATQPDVDEALVADGRLPVLYVRPFGAEAVLFAELPRTWRQVLADFTQTADRPTRNFLSFEEFFADAVRAEIGPLVALGNPTDRLPPMGANREYLPDSGWQHVFVELATRAGCIVATAGRSANTEWEFGLLRRSGHQSKLFLVTSPFAREGSDRRGRFTRALIRGLSAGNPEKIWTAGATPWAETVVTFRALGYDITFDDPGVGAVMTFDDDGQAELLVAGAQRPAEYIRAIQTRLAVATRDV